MAAQMSPLEVIETQKTHTTAFHKTLLVEEELPSSICLALGSYKAAVTQPGLHTSKPVNIKKYIDKNIDKDIDRNNLCKSYAESFRVEKKVMAANMQHKALSPRHMDLQYEAK